MAIVKRGDHHLNGQGLPAVHVPADTEESALDLANAMYASGVYPAGLSPCFTSGINGDWEAYGGICPFWGTDTCECDIEDVFRECLDDMGIKESDWHKMSNDEKQEAVEASHHA